ncbi:MAG: hypothetical protein ABSD97_06055 [Acidimicrobiales bacterium]
MSASGAEGFDAVMGSGTRRPRLGKVESFDGERGLGSVVSRDGAVFSFHSTAISDGSRHIAVGTLVSFVVAACHGGRFEAVALSALDGADVPS